MFIVHLSETTGNKSTNTYAVFQADDEKETKTSMLYYGLQLLVQDFSMIRGIKFMGTGTSI